MLSSFFSPQWWVTRRSDLPWTGFIGTAFSSYATPADEVERRGVTQCSVGCVNINAKHISANKKKANKYKKPRVALALQGLQQSLPVSLFKKIPFSVCVFPATYRDFECADLSVRALLQVWGATGVCVSPELHSASQQLLILIKKGWETITTHPVPPCFITVRKGDSVFISLTYRIWPLSPLK